MTLQSGDVHFVFDAGARTVKAFDHTGHLLFSAEARNRTVDQPPDYGFQGPLPPGEYVFGIPSHRATAPFGPWFVPILDAPGSDELARRGRSGLGWHGGGSGLADPFADRQGWIPTRGCERSQNGPLKVGVRLIQKTQANGHRCFVTNVVTVPGEPADEPDDWADVDLSQLDPDE